MFYFKFKLPCHYIKINKIPKLKIIEIKHVTCKIRDKYNVLLYIFALTGFL